MENRPVPALSRTEIEYATLREEVLKRVESRQQTISIALTLAGAFLGLGWNAGSVVILLYPLIALLEYVPDMNQWTTWWSQMSRASRRIPP